MLDQTLNQLAAPGNLELSKRGRELIGHRARGGSARLRNLGVTATRHELTHDGCFRVGQKHRKVAIGTRHAHDVQRARLALGIAELGLPTTQRARPTRGVRGHDEQDGRAPTRTMQAHRSKCALDPARNGRGNEVQLDPEAFLSFAQQKAGQYLQPARRDGPRGPGQHSFEHRVGAFGRAKIVTELPMASNEVLPQPAEFEGFRLRRVPLDRSPALA